MNSCVARNWTRNDPFSNKLPDQPKTTLLYPQMDTGVTIDRRGGNIEQQRDIVSFGLGIYGDWLPDGAPGNDSRLELHLFTAGLTQENSDQLPGQVFNHPRTPYVDQKVLAGCVQEYFGWQLLKFEPSTRGGLGSFKGKGPSYLRSNPNPENNQELTITNNAASYSISYLKYKYAELGSPIRPGYDVYGLSA